MKNIIGTTALSLCPICGNYTVDEDGNCHYAYCDDDYGPSIGDDPSWDIYME